jgi:hypothetical protein
MSLMLKCVLISKLGTQVNAEIERDQDSCAGPAGPANPSTSSRIQT